MALAAAFGAAAYVAVFMAIGCIAQRAAVWSLAFVFLVERLLGAALSGIAQLSPSWEARAAFVGLADVQPSASSASGIPDGTGALVRLVLITLAVAPRSIAARRLPRLRDGRLDRLSPSRTEPPRRGGCAGEVPPARSQRSDRSWAGLAAAGEDRADQDRAPRRARASSLHVVVLERHARGPATPRGSGR